MAECPSAPWDHDYDRPRVAVICGSTKQREDFERLNALLTLQGKAVLTVGLFGQTDYPHFDWATDGSDIKVALDTLHLRKIDMADEVHVITKPDGSLGESTLREERYARSIGLPVYLYGPESFVAIGRSLERRFGARPAQPGEQQPMETATLAAAAMLDGDLTVTRRIDVTGPLDERVPPRDVSDGHAMPTQEYDV